MNSKKLIETYPEVYEKFFSSQNIVVSTPFLMNRSDDLFPEYSGISIKQKIPLRLYMGSNKNKSKTITITSIDYRDSNEQKFIHTNLLEYAPYFYHIQEIVNKTYAPIIEEYGGFDIAILSELPRGSGLGFDALVSMLFTSLIYTMTGTVNQETLGNLCNVPINDAFNTETGIQKILSDSFEIDLRIYGKTLFTRKISSLFCSYYPIVSFTEDFSTIRFATGDEQYKRFAFRLNELFADMKEMPYIPLDYGIAYSGRPMLFEQVINKNLINTQISEHMKKEFKPIFIKHVDNLLPIRRPKFYSSFLEENQKDIADTYGKMMGMVSMEILYFMYKLFHLGYKDVDMKGFIRSLDKLRYGNYIVRDSSEGLIAVVNKILGNLKTNRHLVALFPNDTSVMGGSLCFVMPSEGFRKGVVDAISTTAEEFAGIHILYASRLDGTEHEGLKIEQDISRGHYSSFLNANSYLLKSNDAKQIISNHEEVIVTTKQGILLDTIDNKIYLQGKRLTSQDLHSQSGTIEILKILMKELGAEVSNKDLPFSSYSKNKNEMIGKIIMPLIELVEKETGKRLPLICKGSMHDFYIKLNRTDLHIATIERLRD